MNRVTLQGFVGLVKSSEKVTNATVCTKESYKDKETNEWVTKDTWHNLTLFGKLASGFTERVAVGDSILLEGKIEYQKYEGKFYTKIIVSWFRIMKKRDENGNTTQSSINNTKVPSETNTAMSNSLNTDDDLPF